jgi:phage tail tape-measure protein
MDSLLSNTVLRTLCDRHYDVLCCALLKVTALSSRLVRPMDRGEGCRSQITVTVLANLSMPGMPPLIFRITGRSVLPVSLIAAVLAAHERNFSRLVGAQGRSAAATRVSTLVSGGGTYTH